MKLAILGLWRDSEPYINTTLKSLEKLKEICDPEFYFYENDSVDNTYKILSDWMLNKKGKLISEKLNAPKFGSVPNIERLILLSYYRNKSKELISNYYGRYTLLLDTDIKFNNGHLLDLISNIEKTNAVMLSANTRQHQIPDLMFNRTNDSFYDVFAMRDQYYNNGLYFTDCPFVLEKDRQIWNDEQPVKCKSAFGGFAIVKNAAIQKANWSTCQHSEHVNFCLDIGRFGDILISPSCRTQTDIDLSSINFEACKNIAEQQIQFVDRLNQVYSTSIATKISILNHK